MNQQQTSTTKTRRPRICKGLLVASTNTARIACMKQYLTIYLFRPFSYSIVKRVILDIPLLN